MKPVVIFGAGKIAEVVAHYFRHASAFEVSAFACDRDYVTGDKYLGLPLASFDELPARFPPSEFDMFVALGYQQLNQLRSNAVQRVRDAGYELVSYIHPHANLPSDFQHGENCFVLENQAIQPGVKIGDNVFVFSGAVIGHHSNIDDNCWITSAAAISGSVTLGRNCFVGANATIGHAVEIGADSIIGAGCLITRSYPEKSVIVQPDTPTHRLNSDQFMKLTKLF